MSKKTADNESPKEAMRRVVALANELSELSDAAPNRSEVEDRLNEALDAFDEEYERWVSKCLEDGAGNSSS